MIIEPDIGIVFDLEKFKGIFNAVSYPAGFHPVSKNQIEVESSFN